MENDRAKKASWWLTLLGVPFVYFTWQQEASVWLIVCGAALLIVRKKLSGAMPHEHDLPRWKLADALHRPLAAFCVGLAALLAIVFVLNLGLFGERDAVAVFAVQSQLLAFRDLLDFLSGLGSFWQKALLLLLLVIGAFLSRALFGDEGLLKNLTIKPRRALSYVSIVVWFLIAFCAFALFSFPYGDTVAQERLEDTNKGVRVVSTANEQARLTAAVNKVISGAIAGLQDVRGRNAFVSKLEESMLSYISDGSTSSEAGKAVAEAYIQASWPGPGSGPGSLGNSTGGSEKSTGDVRDPRPILQPSREAVQAAGPTTRKKLEVSLDALRSETAQLKSEVDKSDSVLRATLSKFLDGQVPLPEGFRPFLESFVTRTKSFLSDRLSEEGAKTKAVQTARYCFAQPIEQWVKRSSLVASLDQSIADKDWSLAQSQFTELEILDHDYAGREDMKPRKSLIDLNVRTMDIEADIGLGNWEAAINAYDSLPAAYVGQDEEQRVRVLLAQSIIQLGEDEAVLAALKQRLTTPDPIEGGVPFFRSDDLLVQEIAVQSSELLAPDLICPMCQLPLWAPGCIGR